MNYSQINYTKETAQHNRNMIKMGATVIYNVGDMNSIYSANRAHYGAFKPHAGYKQCTAPFENYYASYYGEILGVTGYTIKPRVNNAGYAMIAVKKNGKPTTTTANNLTARAWLDNPYQLSDVDHLNDNKLDNCVDNLRWISHQDNLLKKHRIEQVSGKNATSKGLAITKVNPDGSHVSYKSASEAGLANELSYVSVLANARGQLKLNKQYHFIFA